MALRTGQLLMDLFQRSPRWKDLQGEEFDRFRNTLLEIGDDIVSICEKHNLTYCLAYGSALGSVRHNGFIPWDDDVDFFMPRQDYLKFMAVMEEEMGDKYYVRSVSKGDKIGAPTCHVRLKGTRYVNYGDLVLTANEPDEARGIYIDINPLDDCSDNSFIRWLNGMYCLFLLFASSCVNVLESIAFIEKEDIELKEEEKKALQPKVLLGKLFSSKTVCEWVKKYDKAASRVVNPNSKYVTCYTGYKNLKKAVFRREDIFPCSKGEFEGRQWNMPNNPDSFLKQVYGDYMTPPPDGKHKIHPIFELEFENRGVLQTK